MVTEQKTIAIFDFDGTLIKGDSLWPFLVAVAGLPRCLYILAMALVKINGCPQKERRTFIKSYLLKETLGGRRVADLEPAVKKVQAWVRWIEPTRKALMEHHASGHHIMIASGSLDLYLPVLLKDIPCDTVLCTRMEVENGVLSGRMLTGNCVRERKAEMVGDFLATHGPFEDSWGYGNLPHDLPMLHLVKNRVVV